jgi:SAM-dependent methyltransferase
VVVCDDDESAAPMSADHEAYKRGQRELWSSGDYAVTARRFEDAAAQLVAACGIGAGARVLDVAAGNGNGALAAAAAGATATASDLTPSLVDSGRARCAAAGMQVDWTVADAEQLPFADESFDATISVFGLVLAPRPDVAIAEAFRVTRAGGIVGMTSWTSDSAAARFGAIGARHLPAPAPPLPACAPNGASPHEWGDEATARERFAAHCGDDVRFELGSVRWSWPSAAAAREELEQANSFVASARRTLSPERLIAYVDELEDLIRSMSDARDGGVAYDARYARIVGRKRA